MNIPPDSPLHANEPHVEDDAIPLLVDIVTFDGGEPRLAPAAVTPPPAEPDWSDIERRVSERVLERLQRHADHLVDDAVREALATALERAASHVTAEARAALSQHLRALVERAVAEEMMAARKL